MRYAQVRFARAVAPFAGEVFSVRQRGETGSGAHAVQATGALLQERNKRHEKLLHQFSEYGTAAVTPGAADSCGKSIKATACVTFQGRAGCQRGSYLGEDGCWQQRQTLDRYAA